MAERQQHVVAPAVKVTAATEGGFKKGQVLQTWDEIHRYYKDMMGSKITLADVKAAYKEYPHDDDDGEDQEIERVEWIEKNSQTMPSDTDLAEPRSATSVSDPTRAHFLKLGEMLDVQASSHLAQYTGKAKEDYDGSVVVAYYDLKRVDKQKDGKLLSQLLCFEPGTYPIGSETNKGGVQRKSLPSGSNKVPDKYLVPKGDGKTTWRSRTEDFCEGVQYGRSILDARLYWSNWKQWYATNGKSPKPTADETAAVCARWKDIPEQEEYDERTVDAMYDRFNTRMQNLVNRMRLTLLFLLQEQRSDEIPGLELHWVHDAPEMRQVSKKPIWLSYSWRDADGNKKLDATKRGISIATFCNYKIDEAWANHKPHANFISELQNTVSRNVDPLKAKPINMAEPSPDNVNTMAMSISGFLESDTKATELLTWLNNEKERDIRLEQFARAAIRMNRFYTSFVKQPADKLAAAKLQAARKQQEAEQAYAKAHDTAA